MAAHLPLPLLLPGPACVSPAPCTTTGSPGHRGSSPALIHTYHHDSSPALIHIPSTHSYTYTITTAPHTNASASSLNQQLRHIDHSHCLPACPAPRWRRHRGWQTSRPCTCWTRSTPASAEVRAPASRQTVGRGWSSRPSPRASGCHSEAR